MRTAVVCPSQARFGQSRRPGNPLRQSRYGKAVPATAEGIQGPHRGCGLVYITGTHRLRSCRCAQALGSS